MKYIIVLSIALLLSSPAWGTIAATANHGHNSATSGTITATVTINPGDTVMVGVLVNGGTTRTLTMVDSAGNTGYAQRAFQANSTTDQSFIWGALNVANSATTVTVTVSGTYAVAIVDVQTYTGVGTNGFGNTNTAPGNSSSPSVAVTTQDANNFVVMAGTQLPATAPTFSSSVGTLRDQLQAGSTSIVGINDNTAASAGSVTNTISSNKSSIWAVSAVELRSTNSGGVVRHRAQVINN